MAELSASEKSGRRTSQKKLSVRVDLTAMVDLAFLLITFFMLTTSLSKPRAMSLAMPFKGPPGGVAESSTMTICLGNNNQAVFYRGMADKPLSTPAIVNYGKNGLRRAIIETGKEIFKTTGKNMMVVIKPSSHAVYANLVATLDELDITKVQSYAIADISTKDIELLKQQKAY
ncbi:MAG: biopolymer transporter ExbD [Mucilaginibacter sp.]|nr:biopolymer transporter ExbD [Mucilaginibacter sp.]